MKQKMSTENLEEIDIFSSDPTERKIEEDFLRRMLESMRQNSQALLDGQGDEGVSEFLCARHFEPSLIS